MSRRVVVSEAGGPEVLRVIEESAPRPASGQVRLRVAVAGVAYGDVMRRRGVLAPRRPFTPGYDVAGVIDAIGSGVSDRRVGDRVACMMPRVGIGGYADSVCVPARSLVAIPKSVSMENALCLGLNYITAHQLLHRVAKLSAGQRVLIHGAAGGVGSALLELGRRAGLEIYGTASAAKHDLLGDYGATAIDYRNEDFVERIRELTAEGVDAVFDGIGGDHLRRSYAALRPEGMLIAYGVSGDVNGGLWGVARGMATLARLKVQPSRRQVRFYAITASRASSPARCREDWAALLAMQARGELAPQIGARVPLDAVAHAHELIDQAAVRGKIVLACSPAAES